MSKRARDTTGGLPRVLVQPLALVGVGQEVQISREESQHLHKVLRRQPDDEVLLIDGAGSEAKAELSSSTGDSMIAKVLTLRREQQPVGCPKVLALGALHSQAMDWAVQKAVEVGVERFVPLLAQRSQLGPKVAQARLHHWKRLALQSLKQCGRLWAMVVDPPVHFEDFVRDRDMQEVAVADPSGEWYLQIAGSRRLTVLMVGPEGGFSEAERARLRTAGASSVCFGSNILRADTAAVVGAGWLVAHRNVEGD